MPSAAERRLFFVVVAVVVVLDIITKAIAEAYLPGVAGVPVLGEFFQLRLVYNQGAAFGLHLGPFSRWFFLGFAVVAVGVLNLLSRSAEAGDWIRQLACGLVAGGATGNLIDRIRSARGVVDFLDFGIGAYRWPTFNVADIAVTCGAVALAVSFWREDLRRSAAASRAG
jgi:signal peptidase II